MQLFYFKGIIKSLLHFRSQSLNSSQLNPFACSSLIMVSETSILLSIRKILSQSSRSKFHLLCRISFKYGFNNLMSCLENTEVLNTVIMGQCFIPHQLNSTTTSSDWGYATQVHTYPAFSCSSVSPSLADISIFPDSRRPTQLLQCPL